jgi:hypothetical protein
MPWINPKEMTVEGARVRVSESDSRNRHGASRYMIEVLDAGPATHVEFCDWNVWLGHCYGQLFLPLVVANARKQCAADECKSPTLCNDFSACDVRLMAQSHR